MPGWYPGPMWSTVCAEVWLVAICSALWTSFHGPPGPFVVLYTPLNTVSPPPLNFVALCTAA